MVRRKILHSAALAMLATLPLLAACDDDVLNPPDPVNPIFARYVAIGNSLNRSKRLTRNPWRDGKCQDSCSREDRPRSAERAVGRRANFEQPTDSWGRF